MQFGQVENPGLVDFALPEDHPDTRKVLAKQKPGKAFHVWVGCAKWNKKDLKGFYPRGVPDELAYYAGQLNSSELNATFYHSPDAGQVEAWKKKTPEGFLVAMDVSGEGAGGEVKFSLIKVTTDMDSKLFSPTK